MAASGAPAWPATHAPGPLQAYAQEAAPLGAALARFAAQAGVLLVFDPDLVRGLQAPALTGRHDVAGALEQLLAASGLQAWPQPDGSYVLRAADPSVARLATVLVRGRRPDDPAAQVYGEPRSSSHLDAEQLDRFGRISASDVLKGVSGVQVGDSRNGGGLDVNIRGIQGQGRVAVRVDGAQQALDVYRGYGGTQQRSYIDPDLISDITVRKGPDLRSGAVGGQVEMSTLGVQDILRDGQSVGLRLRSEFWNNGASPAYRSTDRVPGAPDPDLAVLPRSGRGSLFGSEAQAGSVAFAYASEQVDVVAAYALRGQGNYFAGRHGQDRYRSFADGREQPSVASIYNAGEEVFNSSASTRSALLKATLRPAAGHLLELGYRRYDGRLGEIMPSDIFRSQTAGIWQYPQGETDIDTLTARYRRGPADDPRTGFTASLWMTDAQTSQITTVRAPASQAYRSNRSWTRQANRRIGAELADSRLWQTRHGALRLDLGGSFQQEDLRPQSSVVITQHDLNANRLLGDASRREFNLHGKLDWQPAPGLSLWAGSRISHYRTQDNNALSTARREVRLARSVMVRNAATNQFGFMLWYPDANGEFTDATDPRLQNGVVFQSTNFPFEGVPYDDFGATTTFAFEPQVTNVVTGYDFSPGPGGGGSGFAPAMGVSYEFATGSLAYASYTQGVRLPSLFETSLGMPQVLPGERLRPERAGSLELGVSTVRRHLLTGNDTASFKLTYFDNNIRNYITRYYDPDPAASGDMQFSNADSFRARGLEWQSNYDTGRFFADVSATYYLKTRTCDAAFARHLRELAGRFLQTQDTPDCTPGSFMGSYANTQNPPKLALNLTAGTRLFNGAMTAGARMVHTSGPTAQVDQPWQVGATTPQLLYRPVTLLDLFLSYRLGNSAMLQVSVQNLTDRYYLDPLAQSFMPAPGRTLRVGLQAQF